MTCDKKWTPSWAPLILGLGATYTYCHPLMTALAMNMENYVFYQYNDTKPNRNTFLTF